MRRTVLLVAALAAATPAAGQRYLTGPGVALIDILPPAPQTGSLEEAADLATFRTTRGLEGSARWQQAIGDVDEAVPAMLADFTPAAGRTLSLSATPKLAKLLARIRGDVTAAVNAVKQVYVRRRPFTLAPGPICQPEIALKGSPDYPSGHTSWGTAISLMLAELIPDRAVEILTRGRN